MSSKKLEPNSQYEKYDLDGDGIVSDEEFEMDQKLMRLENENAKEDAQRHMAWFVVIAVMVGLTEASKILGSMASVYFVSVAAIVAAFFAKEAYAKSKDTSSK